MLCGFSTTAAVLLSKANYEQLEGTPAIKFLLDK